MQAETENPTYSEMSRHHSPSSSANLTDRKGSYSRARSRGLILILMLIVGAMVLSGCGPNAEEQAKHDAGIKKEEARNIELCRDSAVCGEQSKMSLSEFLCARP